MEKRILILTAGFGEGHNSAARGIRDGLTAVSGGMATVALHDIFSESYGLGPVLSLAGWTPGIRASNRPAANGERTVEPTSGAL
jgi:hypothetical protein